MTNLEKLITATPGQIRDMFCENCDKCPNFIFERCDAGKNGFVEWLNEEAKTQKDSPKDAPKDVPRGWIKLKSIVNDIYIDVSKIVGLGNVTPGTGLATGAVTEVYTIGDEDNPWIVYERIDEIMWKIERHRCRGDEENDES